MLVMADELDRDREQREQREHSDHARDRECGCGREQCECDSERRWDVQEREELISRMTMIAEAITKLTGEFITHRATTEQAFGNVNTRLDHLTNSLDQTTVDVRKVQMEFVAHTAAERAVADLRSVSNSQIDKTNQNWQRWLQFAFYIVFGLMSASGFVISLTKK
jgi:hypothetical protein